MRFKKGDKVKRIKGINYKELGVITGSIYNVVGYTTGGHLKLEGIVNNGWIEEYFELLGSRTLSELEQLVQKANEGEEATKTLLLNYIDQIEMENLDSPGVWNKVPRRQNIFKWRIKEKPKFEYFTIITSGNLVGVSLNEDGLLQVGCQKFNPKDLKESLKDIIKSNANRIKSDHFELLATKRGIGYNDTVVSWEEAEKVLNALETAGF